MQNTEFKAGDTVWCAARGKGVVYHVEEYDCTVKYPITVHFEDNARDYYTLGGKMHMSGPCCLFFSEPKVEAQITRPFVPTLKGKKCIAIFKAYPDEASKVDIFDETEYTIVINPNGSYWRKDLIQELYEIGENLVDNSKANN